jgi:hypothetical protein
MPSRRLVIKDTHPIVICTFNQDVDGRDKPGHDGAVGARTTRQISSTARYVQRLPSVAPAFDRPHIPRMTRTDPTERGPERPRHEPEIIPPGRDRAGKGGFDGVWISIDERDGTRRVHVARPGPFSIIVGLMLIGLVVAVVFLLLAGLVLVWIPIVVIGIVLALLSGSIRHYWHRARAWWASRR